MQKNTVKDYLESKGIFGKIIQFAFGWIYMLDLKKPLNELSEDELDTMEDGSLEIAKKMN